MIRKLFYRLSLCLVCCGFAAATSSCGGDDNNPDLTETITILSSDLIFEPLGRTGSVEVQAFGTITAELESDWCTATVNGNVINVTVEDNNTFEGRTALLIIHADGAQRKLPVQQRGMALGSLPVSSHHSPKAGERFSLYIRHDLPIHLNIDDDWIHAEVVGDSMIINVDRAPNNAIRRGLIEFECGGFESQLDITQYDMQYVLGNYYFAGTGQGGVAQAFRFRLKKVGNDYFMNFLNSDNWENNDLPVEFNEGLCELTFHSATVLYEEGANRDIFYFFQSDGAVVTSPTATMKARIYYNPFVGTHYAALEDGGTWIGSPLIGFVIYMTRSIVTTPVVQLVDPYIMWIGDDEN